MKTEVLAPNAAQFDLCGRRLTQTLRTTDASIKPGLAARLRHYALGVLETAGFIGAVEGWTLLVYTVDGDLPPSERSYCVRLTNALGGYIEVIGILTRHGWPTVDHGLDIGVGA
ncbi:hypothetical protein [Achromobacter sp. AGC39]